MNVIEGRFDKRASHLIFSEPAALDVLMDATAIAQRGTKYAEASHWIALGYDDPQLVHGITVAHECLNQLLEIAKSCAALIEGSVRVDPYRAAEAAA